MHRSRMAFGGALSPLSKMNVYSVRAKSRICSGVITRSPSGDVSIPRLAADDGRSGHTCPAFVMAVAPLLDLRRDIPSRAAPGLSPWHLIPSHLRADAPGHL